MGLRVLHLVGSADRQAGSVSILLDGLVEALAEAGVDSEIVGPVETGGGTDKSEFRMAHSELAVHDSPFFNHQAAVVGWSSATSLAARVSAADVVHVHGLDGDFACDVGQAARRAGVPYVVSPLGQCSPNAVGQRWVTSHSASDNRFHGTGWFHDLRVRRRRRRMLAGAAAVTVLNETEAAIVARLRRGGDVRVLPYGLPFDRRAPLQECQSVDTSVLAGHRCLLFLGPIDPMEGLVPLLRAMAELGRDFRGWKLVLAGPEPGPWRRKIEAALVRKRAMDRVVFVSHPDASVQGVLLDRASIVVAPSLRLQCPVSVHQGIAAGAAVAATDHGLSREAASVVRLCPCDHRGIRDVLRPMIARDDDSLRAFGAAACEALRPVLSWPVLVERYVELYRTVLGRARRRTVGVGAE